MTPNAYRAWRAQSPPPNFAERTVAAILHDRIASGRAVPPRRTEVLVARARRQSTYRSRRMSALAIACLLVVGGAWGAWAALPRSARTAASLPDAVPIDVTRTHAPLWRAPAESFHAVDPPRPPPAPAKPAPPQKAPPQPKEMAPAVRARPVNLPRCGCDPEICDCVEPQ